MLSAVTAIFPGPIIRYLAFLFLGAARLLEKNKGIQENGKAIHYKKDLEKSFASCPPYQARGMLTIAS